MASNSSQHIVAIILNWNRVEDTLECLKALSSLETVGAHLRIVLVDNGSSDGSVPAVRAAMPEVEVIALPENRGYAAGMNVGIRHALEAAGRHVSQPRPRCEWTLLVNNDAVPEPDMLTLLLAAGADGDVGMITPTVVVAGAAGRVWPAAGWRRTATLAAFDTTADPPSTEPYDVDWATGCCLLVRTALWETVGLFDERYRVYYEDHDLCLRARAVGWRIVHVPAARVVHRVSASTGVGSPAQMYLLGRSSVVYYFKHTHGLHRVVIFAYRCGSLMSTVLRALASGRPASAVAYAKGLRDGVRDVTRGEDGPGAGSGGARTVEGADGGRGGAVEGGGCGESGAAAGAHGGPGGGAGRRAD